MGYQQYVNKYAQQFGVSPDLINSVIRAESGGDPNAGSHAGAQGLMQLMPGTARGLGVKDSWNPEQNIMGGTKYLSQLLNQYKNVNKALAAYNAGPGAVNKYGGIPPFRETQDYVKRVKGFWGGNDWRYNSAGRPVRSGGAAPSLGGGWSGGPSDKKLVGIQHAFWDNPQMAKILMDREYKLNPLKYTAKVNGGAGKGAARVSGDLGIKTGARDWRWLQRIGESRFGLRNDPGDSQTTGGRHSANSRHYDDKAIDFGDARNSWEQLNKWYNWANANKNKYGFSEVLNEGDHIHVAF